MQSIGAALGALVLFVSIVLAASLLFSLPVWLLWNGCLVGAVAGVAEITWLQAWGITILCSFLFKSSSSSKG